MRLSYRGHGYDYEPVEANAVEGDVAGRYRWQTTQPTAPRHVAVPVTPNVLYPRAVTPSAGANPAAMWMSQPARTHLQARQESRGEVDFVHLQNIHNRLQHRLCVAASRGDQHLVTQLEQEMSQMVCLL